MTNICMRVYCTSGLPPEKKTKPSNDDDDDDDDDDNDNLFFYNDIVRKEMITTVYTLNKCKHSTIVSYSSRLYIKLQTIHT